MTNTDTSKEHAGSLTHHLKKLEESLKRPLNVIQAGCNDGTMCDPLFDYLKTSDADHNCVFIDAVSYYVLEHKKMWEKMNRAKSKRWLCAGFEKISKCQSPVSSEIPMWRKFYFIDPSIATSYFFQDILIDNATPPYRANALVTGPNVVLVLPEMKGQNLIQHLRGVGSFDRSWVENAIKGQTSKQGMLGQFSKEVFGEDEKSQSEMISCCLVPVMSYNHVVQKAGFEDVDALVMDLEGYDGEILAEIDKFNVKPTLVYFELRDLSKPLVEKIQKAGYDFIGHTENNVNHLIRYRAGIV